MIFCLLRSRISLTIFNISSVYSMFFSSSDIFSSSTFKLLHLLLISFTNSLFFFLSFVSYNCFIKALDTEKWKYVWKKSEFMPFDSFSMSLKNLLIPFFSDYSSSFIWNPSMYGKMSVLNASITSCLLFNNFSAAFNVSSLDFIFFRFVGL